MDARRSLSTVGFKPVQCHYATTATLVFILTFFLMSSKTGSKQNKNEAISKDTQKTKYTEGKRVNALLISPSLRKVREGTRTSE